MKPLPEAPSEATTPVDALPADTGPTASLVDYQQLLLAYQNTRQERGMLRQAVRAFRLSRKQHKSQA